MKSAYRLLDRARKYIADPENDMTVAKLAEISGIKDPTLRRLLQPKQKHKTLECLKDLEAAMDKLESVKKSPQ